MREAIIEGLTDAYTEGKPLIEDEEFDALVDNNDYEKGLVKSKIMHGRLKIRHEHPIYSILRFSNDVDNLGELTNKTFNCNPTLLGLKQSDAILLLKINGVFVSVKYNHLGELEYAVTKGDKVYGMCIKDKLSWFGLPNTLDYSKVRNPKFQEIRAAKGDDFGLVLSFEWCIRNIDHLNLSVNQLYILIGLIMNNKKSAEVYIRSFGNSAIRDYFDLICHNARFLNIKEEDEPAFIQRMGYVRELGFTNICELGCVHVPKGTTKEELKKLLSTFYQVYSMHSEYYTDGIIMKLNKKTKWDKKSPKNNLDYSALAFKTFSYDYLRTIVDIIESVSKNGLVTYIAVLDSDINDSFKKYRRVKLGTKLKIEEMNYKVGDQVYVRIVGDTSAKIVGRLIDNQRVDINPPRLR